MTTKLIFGNYHFYTLGNDYTLDVYNTDKSELDLTFGGKADATLDFGVGIGACLMICGFAPASIDGEVFYADLDELTAFIDEKGRNFADPAAKAKAIQTAARNFYRLPVTVNNSM